MASLVDDKSKALPKMAKLALFLWGMMLWADLALSLFAPELLAILATDKYAEAGTVTGIMGLTYVIGAQYRVFTDIVTYHKQTWVVSSAGLLMALSSLCLNLIFVPLCGWRASAFVIVASSVIYALWIFFWGRKWEKLPISYGRYAILLLCFVFFFVIFQKFNFKTWSFLGVISKLVVVSVFGFIVFKVIKGNSTKIKDRG
jgi:O-antigen/teichoic acid export membrane protein